LFFELLGAKVQNNCKIAMREMPIIPEMPVIPGMPMINFAKGASHTGSRSTTGGEKLAD